LIVELARCGRSSLESFVAQFECCGRLPLRQQRIGLHEQADPFHWFAENQWTAFAGKNFFTQCLTLQHRPEDFRQDHALGIHVSENIKLRQSPLPLAKHTK
jgi:hypothetical protein